MTIFYTLVRALALFLLRTFFRMKVYGRESLPRRGGFILASNHTSFLDPVVLAVASPRSLSFMAKKELFKGFIFGKLISALGAFPLSRERADIWAIREAIRRLKDGGALILFPEGTRTSEEKLAEGLPGAGILAIKAGVPIVPVLIIGAEAALPKKARFVRFRPIRVYLLERVIPKEVKATTRPQAGGKEGYEAISRVVMERIQDAMRKYGD